MTKLIKNWQELAKVPANDKYRIIVEDCCGWIVPVCDEPSDKSCEGFKCNCENMSKWDFTNYNDYFDYHVYLSTHTFYGKHYKHSTEIFQKYGFDIEIDNWDKEDK